MNDDRLPTQSDAELCSANAALVAERLGLNVRVGEPEPDHYDTKGPCDGFGVRGECSICTGIVERDQKFWTTGDGMLAILEAMRAKGGPLACGRCLFRRQFRGKRGGEGWLRK